MNQKETIVQALTIVLHDAACGDRSTCDPTVMNGYRKMAEAVMDSTVPQLIRATEHAKLDAMSRNMDNGRLFAGAGWPEILRTAARELRRQA